MKFCHISPVLFGCVFAASLGSTPAQAQTSTQPDELQAIYACKSISNAQKRLACYDNSVGRFEAAEKSGDVVTVSKTTIEKVERDAFGFNIPSLPSLGRIFGGKPDKKPSKVKKEDTLTAPVKQANRTIPSEDVKGLPVLSKPEPSKVKKVTLNIRKTTQFARNKTRFFMENGQVWEQIETTHSPIRKIKAGRTAKATISKASLGSFLLRVNGKGAAIRVRRVR